ncbi:MAG: hypothetical protein OEY29_13455 [Gammaproteobacteria bacterium]|nr:hypothetical protein [Gammaproteobacteria bacterium]
MYVSAVSSFFNPYDVTRVAGVRPRSAQAESQTQQTAEQSRPERVIQGEVLSRERLQNNKLSSTNDALAKRQFNHQQSGFGFNASQAINTYIANQARGENIDSQLGSDQIIDVYV